MSPFFRGDFLKTISASLGIPQWVQQFARFGSGITVAAFTFGDVIHLREDVFDNVFSSKVTRSNLALVAHEAIHVVQARGFDTAVDFGKAYLHEWAWKLLPNFDGQRAYDDNSFEVQADEFEIMVRAYLP